MLVKSVVLFLRWGQGAKTRAKRGWEVSGKRDPQGIGKQEKKGKGNVTQHCLTFCSQKRVKRRMQTKMRLI